MTPYTAHQVNQITRRNRTHRKRETSQEIKRKIIEMAAQVNRRRTALAEIPVRMSQLRVSTDEMPVLLNRTVIDSPLDNIPIGYLTPSPSQDECNSHQILHIHCYFYR